MPDLTHKDRLIIESNNRINRLTIERVNMVKKSPQWYAKTSQINLEKGLIKDLQTGSIHIENLQIGRM